MGARTIAVDWSGALVGQRRKIWLAEVRDGKLIRLLNGRTREEIVEELIALAADDNDLVAGLDFAFSMPAWFLSEQGAGNAIEFWSIVAEKGEDWLRECEPPFWGHRGKTAPPLDRRFRRTERELKPIAGISPKSTLQIAGAGAVGTGSIRGMPFLTRLREGGFSVWPFEPIRLPLVVEIYPRQLTGPVDKSQQVKREVYLALHHPRLDESMARVAAASEDAFDAAVSALVMDRHRDRLRALPEATDDETLLEGAIWLAPEPDSPAPSLKPLPEKAQAVREAPARPTYSTRLRRDHPGDLLPRERLRQHGPQTLSDIELLAVLLGRGIAGFNVLEVAGQLMAELKTIPGVQKATLRELQEVRGLGEAKAMQIKAALELGRRLTVIGDETRVTVRSPLDVAMLLISDMGLLEQEELRVVLLNTRNQIVATETVYRGSVNSAQVRSAEVVRVAVRANVPAMVLVHNHPSGDPTPSSSDVEVTRKLVAAARNLDIEIMDHVVIGNPKWVSMKQLHLGFDR